MAVHGRLWAPGLLLAVLVILLHLLSPTDGLGFAGWFVGLSCAAVVHGAVVLTAIRCAHRLGPADVVTLFRATLTCGVAALHVGAEGRPPVSPLVALAVSALVLDLVDGWLARATGTASTFGARFDGEADALLMLVLSVHVAGPFGLWVLAVGAARYLFGAVGIILPWMRVQLPPRPWRKVVAATAGTVLAVAAAQVLAHSVVRVGLVLALLLLAESFGRDVWWLVRRHRAAAPRDGSDERRIPVMRAAE